MKKTWIELAAIFQLWVGVAVLLTSEAATTFSGAIVGIDHAPRTITFQTMAGQTWTLAVADSNILKQEQVAKDDRVRIEIDLSGKITKITKIFESPSSSRTEPIP